MGRIFPQKMLPKRRTILGAIRIECPAQKQNSQKSFWEDRSINQKERKKSEKT